MNVNETINAIYAMMEMCKIIHDGAIHAGFNETQAMELSKGYIDTTLTHGIEEPNKQEGDNDAE